jgi:hypothetical protein
MRELLLIVRQDGELSTYSFDETLERRHAQLIAIE